MQKRNRLLRIRWNTKPKPPGNPFQPPQYFFPTFILLKQCQTHRRKAVRALCCNLHMHNSIKGVLWSIFLWCYENRKMSSGVLWKARVGLRAHELPVHPSFKGPRAARYQSQFCHLFSPGWIEPGCSASQTLLPASQGATPSSIHSSAAWARRTPSGCPGETRTSWESPRGQREPGGKSGATMTVELINKTTGSQTWHSCDPTADLLTNPF